MPEVMPEPMPEPMPERLPKQRRDTHRHIFGDAAAYPVANANALYQPPQAWILAMVKALHDAMGVERAVFVSPQSTAPITGRGTTC
jgi:predicted TIM-barrel fold metal-dependent hydrolase